MSSLALHTSLLVLPCWRENQGVETLSKVAFWSVLSPSGKFSDSSGQGGNSRPHCPTQYSALMEMFYLCSAQYGGHCPQGLLKLWSAPLNVYFYLTLIHLNANTMFYLNVKKKNQYLILLLENSLVSLKHPGDMNLPFSTVLFFNEIYIHRMGISEENLASELKHGACVKHMVFWRCSVKKILYSILLIIFQYLHVEAKFLNTLV